MIELIRQCNVNKELRFCKFCPNSIEDEMHFLTTCKQFTKLREVLMTQVMQGLNLNTLAHMDKKYIFIFLMNNVDVSPFVAKYVTRATQLREYLINEQKRCV